MPWKEKIVINLTSLWTPPCPVSPLHLCESFMALTQNSVMCARGVMTRSETVHWKQQGIKNKAPSKQVWSNWQVLINIWCYLCMFFKSIGPEKQFSAWWDSCKRLRNMCLAPCCYCICCTVPYIEKTAFVQDKVDFCLDLTSLGLEWGHQNPLE